MRARISRFQVRNPLLGTGLVLQERCEIEIYLSDVNTGKGRPYIVDGIVEKCIVHACETKIGSSDIRFREMRICQVAPHELGVSEVSCEEVDIVQIGIG